MYSTKSFTHFISFDPTTNPMCAIIPIVQMSKLKPTDTDDLSQQEVAEPRSEPRPNGPQNQCLCF